MNSNETFTTLKAIQQSVFHYAKIDTDLLDRMVQRGPNYLHAVTNYESNVIRYNLPGSSPKSFPFVFLYLKEGTFWNNHPICLLDGVSWYESSKKEVALQFMEFITQKEQQEKAVQFGIRPADPTISLNVPGSPFTPENGVDPSVNQETIPSFPYPSESVIQEMLNVFFKVKKPTLAVMVIDTSGSMSVENKMEFARAGAAGFIATMNPQDNLIVYAFDSTVRRLTPISPLSPTETSVEKIRSSMITLVNGLYPGGSTALYDVVVATLNTVNQQAILFNTQGIKHNYAVILMTDGSDTSSSISQQSMFNALPNGEDPGQVHFYCIGYGSGADADTLGRIASQTNGKYYSASNGDISAVYHDISLEF